MTRFLMRIFHLRFLRNKFAIIAGFWLLLGYSAQLALAEEEYEYLVVGALIDGKEAAILEALRRQEIFWLPFADVMTLIGATVAERDGAREIQTPLGAVTLHEGDLTRINGATYISQTALHAFFRITLTFDTEEFALHFDIPWRSGKDRRARSPEALQPDILPPDHSFSAFHEEFVSHSGSEEAYYGNDTVIGGRLFGGAWRIGMTHDLQGTLLLEQYDFLKIQRHLLMQAGVQTTQLHPLLNSLEMTGGQVGWTNQPLENFSLTTDARELISRYSTPMQTFRGKTEPGYIAQLRINGQIEAEEEADLNGQYEFANIPLSSYTVNQVEIYIFDYHNTRIPVDIRRLNLTSSDLLLLARKTSLLAGVGVTGNYLSAQLEPELEQTPSVFAGFSQWRYGINEHLTIETAAQQTDEFPQFQAGIIAQPANPIVISGGVGFSNHKTAYSAAFDSILSRWRLEARLFHVPAQFRSTDDIQDEWNDSAVLTLDPFDRLRIGVVARHYKSDDIESDYVLPFARWTPFGGTQLLSYPEYDGNQTFQAMVSLSSAFRLSAMYNDPTWNGEVSYYHGQDKFSIATAFSENDAHPSYTLDFTRNADWALGTRMNAGVSWRDHKLWGNAGIGRYLLPGIRAELNYENRPQTGQNEKREHLVTTRIIVDFTFAGMRPIPTYNNVMYRDRGAIGGRLKLEGVAQTARYDLSGIGLLVDGQQIATTDRAGNFFKSDLAPGIYTVELLTDKLPIEFVIRRGAYIVEVAAGATTRVDFVTSPEFGAAGRVSDAQGRPLAGVLVQAVNASGAIAQSAATDQFGLFRIDGLPPGDYTLRIAPDNLLAGASSTPQRKIVITDDFLFQQDLTWSE